MTAAKWILLGLRIQQMSENDVYWTLMAMLMMMMMMIRAANGDSGCVVACVGRLDDLLGLLRSI